MEKSTFILGILFLLFALNLSSSNARPWKQLVRVKRSSVVKPIEAKVVQETKKVDAGILKLVKRDSAERGIFGDFDGAKVDEIREQLEAEERGTKNVEKPLEIEKAAEILVDTAIDAEKSIRDEDDDDDDVNSQSELEEVEAEEDKALMELENEIIEEEEEEEAEEEAAEEEMEAEEEKQAEAEVEEEEEEKEKEEEVGIDDEDEDDDDDDEFKELLDDFDFDSQFDVASDDGGLLDDPLDGSSDADDEADGQSFWSYMMDAFHLGPGWQQEIEDEMEAEDELYGSKEDEEGYLIGEDDGEFGEYDTDGVGYALNDADLEDNKDKAGTMTMQVVDTKNKKKQRLRRSEE